MNPLDYQIVPFGEAEESLNTRVVTSVSYASNEF